MAYTSVDLSEDTVVRMPAEHAGDEAPRQAHEWLLHLAAPHYNRALAAERDGRIPAALEAARTAVGYGAYAPRIVTSAFLVATKHGDFDLAQRLLAQIQALALDDADAYEKLLRRRVERWNLFLDDPAALRDTYQQPDVSPSYRELLLLADRLDAPPTENERAHLSAVGLSAPEARTTEVESDASVPTVRLIPGLVAACLVGVLLGGSGLYWTQGESEADPDPTATTSPSVPDSLVQAERYEAALQVSILLADERPVRAYRSLDRLAFDSTRAFPIDSLRAATQRALYRTGRRAWDAGNYERVVQTLRPVRDAPVGEPQAKLYALGVAAAKTERMDLSVDVLQDLMPQIDDGHPHYEAQAAYLLVTHGPPNVARRYAQLINDEYDDTLYNNSTVRARLDGS